jgi:hypothetical protein
MNRWTFDAAARRKEPAGAVPWHAAFDWDVLRAVVDQAGFFALEAYDQPEEQEPSPLFTACDSEERQLLVFAPTGGKFHCEYAEALALLMVRPARQFILLAATENEAADYRDALPTRAWVF